MNAFEALAKNSTESIYNCLGSEASYAIGGSRIIGFEGEKFGNKCAHNIELNLVNE